MFKKIFQKILRKKLGKNYTVEFQKYYIVSINCFVFKNLTLYHKDKLIVKIDSFKFVINLFKIFSAKNQIIKLIITNGYISINRKSYSANQNDSTTFDFEYNKRLRIWIKRCFNFEPNLEITNLDLYFSNLVFSIVTLKKNNNTVQTKFIFFNYTFSINLIIDYQKKIISWKESYLQYKSYFSNFKGKLKFHLSADIKISGKILVENLILDSKLLNTKKIKINKSFFSFDLLITSHFLELLNFSLFLDDLPLLIIGRMIPNKSIILKVAIGIFSFRKNFLNKCLSENFNTINYSGNCILKSSLTFNLKNKKCHSLDFEFEDDNLSFISFGELNKLLNVENFSYLVKKENVYIRKIICSDAYPNFISIREVPAIFIHLLVFCEDPNFFKHKGYDSFFIKRAINRNLECRNFKYGASTITMQLIKNLFLNSEKNLFRKFEEMLYSVLIENYLCISKERLLEIYLNIIEFGPNIYGIKEESVSFPENSTF